jgi:hypothetical protein
LFQTLDQVALLAFWRQAEEVIGGEVLIIAAVCSTSANDVFLSAVLLAATAAFSLSRGSFKLSSCFLA